MKDKKYFYLCVLCIVFFILINFFISVFSNFFIDETIEDNLVKYQISKITNEKNSVNNIFLGDSSLGNAINAKIYEKVSGKKTLNLALWGNASFAGAYALMKKLNLSKNQNIYIVSSLDVWSRAPQDSEYDKIISNFDLKNKTIFTIKNIFNYSLNSYRLKWYLNKDKNDDYFINDYITQRNDIKLKKNNFKDINPKKLKYLKKIFNICEIKRVNCLYVHGPIFNAHCEDKNSIKYINEVKILLNENKIKQLDKIFCIKEEHMGDSEDHINPKFKDQFTINFYNFLGVKNFN